MVTVFFKQFSKDIAKIKLATVKNKLALIIEQVELAESISDIDNLKKLKGYTFAFRIKQNYYRIGVYIHDDTVKFVRFLHRKDIYKKFPD